MFQFSSVTQSCLTLWPHGLQHTRLPCPSPTPRAYSNSCPLSRWCHPTVSSSVFLVSSCLQSFTASESFPMSQFFASGAQNIGVSASVSGRFAAAAASLQSCPTLCDPIDGSPPAFPSLGFSRQEHWSGLPFPSSMHESEKWKWSRSVMSDSSDPMDCSLPGSSIHRIF